jgi:hypothetical protein
VAGAVALLLEADCNLTREKITDILTDSSDKVGDVSYENGRNDYYGYGKINLLKAMKSVSMDPCIFVSTGTLYRISILILN